MAAIAFIGFGELGCSLAQALGRSGTNALRAYTRPPAHEAAAAALRERLRRARTQLAPSLEEAVRGAQMVLSVVPASASREVAERCCALLEPRTYYVDLSAAAPTEKQAAAALLETRGVAYVDAAVLGTVAASGPRVPILCSGAGARGWRQLVAPAGLEVQTIEAPAGHAALLKLLRSVYMKGRDALILEMMLAARHYGLEDLVASSIAGPGEDVPFGALAERVLCGLAVHARRRAEELRSSSEVVQAAGVDPAMTRAGSEALGALADLDLREVFGATRPPDGAAVLAAIEQRSGHAPEGGHRDRG